MSKLNKTASAVLALLCFSAPGVSQAATLTEDFEAPFPAWKAGWFGVNSNAQNYYFPDVTSRGNNPDGLWITDGTQDGPANITFNSAFGQSLTSLYFDIAGYSSSVLTIFDSNGNTLLNQNLTLTSGAFTDPGVYVRYGANSTSGIGGFSFTGFAEGNTSIDNIVGTTAEIAAPGGVPEPATWAMMLLGFGFVGGTMRTAKRRQKLTVSYA